MMIFNLLIAPLLLASLPPAGNSQDATQVTKQETEQVTEQVTEQAAREAAFAALLTGSQLVGYFVDNSENPELHRDSYSLTRVTKAEGNLWTFEARIEYRDSAIPIKMDLPVEWAGDTPVITVDDMGFPFLGKYSARVLFTKGHYSGVWDGGDHGGQMFGRVVKGSDQSKQVDQADQTGSGEEERAQREDAGDKGDGDKQAHIEQDQNWPSFRGRFARGVAEGFTTPIAWDLESGESRLWRREVPGLAHSSPVIWGDTLFVTTAVRSAGEQELKVGLYGSIAPVADDSAFRFELHAYDKNSGEERWSRLAWEGVPKDKRHPKGSHAASTPTTDGERVVACFGSEGLYCYSVDGELLWKKDLGSLDAGYYLMPDAQWGFGSSPVLFDGRVLVQCDIQGESFVAALDAANGDELWRTARQEVPTWSTPTVDLGQGRAQVICNGWKHIGGYDLESGQELWRIEGGGDIPVPTPVVANDLVYITNAHGAKAPIYAIEASVSGALTAESTPDDGLIWSQARRGNYMQTPLIFEDQAYFCSDAGILTCVDAKTGDQIYRERLGSGRSGYTSSGVAADGKLYFSSEEGEVSVIDGWTFDVLSVNSLGEECMATPAVSEGVLYYRTRSHLIAIGMGS